MSTFSSTARKVVEKEIDDRTKHIQLITNAALKT